MQVKIHEKCGWMIFDELYNKWKKYGNDCESEWEWWVRVYGMELWIKVNDEYSYWKLWVLGLWYDDMVIIEVVI